MQGNQAHDAHWSATFGSAVYEGQLEIMEITSLHITVILITDKLLTL